jgi:hypothetical protein
MCLTPSLRGAHARDEPERAKDAAQNIFVSAESLSPCRTSWRQDAMISRRAKRWSVSDETNPDQVQDEAGNGRHQRSVDR